jgi:hypothetical protein
MVTTSVLGFGGMSRCVLSGGVGSFVLNLASFIGAATIKIISRTSKTSMSGVTLIKGAGLLAASPFELMFFVHFFQGKIRTKS